jgi:hypothetical protein
MSTLGVGTIPVYKPKCCLSSLGEKVFPIKLNCVTGTSKHGFQIGPLCQLLKAEMISLSFCLSSLNERKHSSNSYASLLQDKELCFFFNLGLTHPLSLNWYSVFGFPLASYLIRPLSLVPTKGCISNYLRKLCLDRINLASASGIVGAILIQKDGLAVSMAVFVFSLYCLPSRNRLQIFLSDSNEKKQIRNAFGVGVGVGKIN